MSSKNMKSSPDHINLAPQYCDAKMLSDTIKELEQLRKRDPLNADVLFRLAVAHQKLEHTDEAEYFYTEVLRIGPNFVDAWLNRGLLRANLGRLREALADAERALELDPQRGLAWSVRSWGLDGKVKGKHLYICAHGESTRHRRRAGVYQSCR